MIPKSIGGELQRIMVRLGRHIKDGDDPQTNKKHYNFVWEEIWRLLKEIDRLKEKLDAFANK